MSNRYNQFHKYTYLYKYNKRHVIRINKKQRQAEDLIPLQIISILLRPIKPIGEICLNFSIGTKVAPYIWDLFSLRFKDFHINK